MTASTVRLVRVIFNGLWNENILFSSRCFADASSEVSGGNVGQVNDRVENDGRGEIHMRNWCLLLRSRQSSRR